LHEAVIVRDAGERRTRKVREGTMRRLRTWGLGAALVAGLGAAIATAGDTRGKAGSAKPSGRWPHSSEGLLHKWFGSKESEPAKPAEAKASKEKEEDTETVAESKPPPNPSAERLRAEEALLRRLAVCDKLMEIAVRTSDAELQRRAEQLDQRARQVYAQHTANLPTAPNPLPSDEDILERHLGAGGPAKKAATSSRSGTDKEKASRAAAKEESR
jgi:hypothetical protein